MRRIIRGYRCRYRDMWSALRWHAYSVMAAMPYTDLAKAGIHKPSDLLHLPWDDEVDGDMPSEEEVEDLQQLIKDVNVSAK